jgi:hypothetical protein
MKVFGIGMQRTGTSSLVQALNILNIKSRHFPSELFYDLNHPTLNEFDGFADNPIPLLYQELDQRQPMSKFILTIRDEEKWIKSAQWLFSTGARKFDWDNVNQRDVIREMHLQLYGTTTFDETIFREKYRSHNRTACEYFANRPNDLLILDLTQNDSFEKLGAFLGKPIPNKPFPHQNQSEGFLWRCIRRIRQSMRRM